MVTGSWSMEMTSTSTESPPTPSTLTVAVRSPWAVGAREKSAAGMVSPFSASPALKVTVWDRLAAVSQVSSWVRVTVTLSASAVSPARVSV